MNQYTYDSEKRKFQFLESLFPNKGPQCWVWQGSRGTKGYGETSFAGKRMSAHRLSWMIHHGPIADGLYVLHKCDNRPCANPEHLFLGTAKDNAADAMKKGRFILGTRQHASKLTAEKVREIRERRKRGETAGSLGREFSVTTVTISQICLRKRWAWLK